MNKLTVAALLTSVLSLAACGKKSAGQSKKTAPQEVGSTGWIVEVPTDCKLAADGESFAVHCGKVRLATVSTEAAMVSAPDCHYPKSMGGQHPPKVEDSGLVWELCEKVSETEPLRKYVAAYMPLADGKALRCDSESVVTDVPERGSVCYKMRKK